MKRFKMIFAVIILAFCIQGCGKQQDVEDHSFVLAMGFERINKKIYPMDQKKLLFPFQSCNIHKVLGIHYRERR